ncbi:LytTR family DNA-binding domain-containing protein [Flavobacterium sp. HSC-61S13]|uniref:LytR/AlgR family response regulator transcription factor n=1 Tax=Flavobacterium sp. HSC-61S13 TaxID=2910963 RepID=UPI00209F4497|nr:response regulator [Flavobacterium sp. HSC-61S13]MCP1996277.1 DNA-binding LytR/AlgR family response regulator [Flavobacterium sp. HSC-61S13]
MTSKLKCILLDDELPGLTYLKMLCEQIPEIEIIKVFNDPLKLLDEAPNLDFDLGIFDIEMPQINGLSVAQLLGNKPVIFTTAYREFAVDAFEIDAIDYITKPIKKERLEKAIQKALKLIKPSEQTTFMTVNSNKGKAVLQFESILHIKPSEFDSRDKVVLLADNSTLILKNLSLEKIIKDLPSKDFCRINKSEIIALKIVSYFNHDEIITTLTTDGKKPLVLTLGVNFKGDFLSKL